MASSLLTKLQDKQIQVYYDVINRDGARRIKVSAPLIDTSFDFYVSEEGDVTMPRCSRGQLIIAADVMKAEGLGV